MLQKRKRIRPGHSLLFPTRHRYLGTEQRKVLESRGVFGNIQTTALRVAGKHKEDFFAAVALQPQHNLALFKRYKITLEGRQKDKG